jgi:hypothetical protein
MRKKLPIPNPRGEEREKLERGRDENPEIENSSCTIEHYLAVLAKSRG